MSDLPPMWGSAATISRTGLTAAIYSTFTVATVLLSLRLTLRWRHNNCFLLDDYLMIFAWLCFIAQTVLQTWQLDTMWYLTYLDFGRIPATDSARGYQAKEMARWQFPVTALFWTVLWSVKASLLLTFYKLVHPISWLRKSLYAVAVFTFLSYVGCWVAYVLTRESPYDMYVLETEDAEHKARASVIYATTVDMASDLLIALLPMNILPSLHLTRGEKFGIGVTFALGLLVVAVAIVRMTQSICGLGVDHVGVALWGIVETATAIVVGSLMSFGGLWTRGIKRSQRSTGYSKHTDTPSKGYSAGWSRSSGSSGARTSDGPTTLVSASERELRTDLEDLEGVSGDERFAIRKTVETDICSEYGNGPSHDNDETELRRKELHL